MLTATFPSEYPRQVSTIGLVSHSPSLLIPNTQAMQLRVTGGQPLQCCLERVNSALNNRIDEVFSNSKLSGQYELMFRPLLRWFDSHVSGIVAACYCQLQQQVQYEEEEEVMCVCS